MDPVTFKLIELGLTAFFQYMEAEGKSEKEALDALKEARVNFKKRKAKLLPDV